MIKMVVNVPPRIKVVGTSETYIQPTTALVTLGAVTEGEELSIAQSENAKIINRVINTLIQLGTNKELIQTEDYRIEPLQEFQKEIQKLTGYRVTHRLRVQVQNVGTIGTLIDSAVQSGANSITSVYLTVENSQSIYTTTLKKAVRDSHKKALAIASSLGVRLAPVPSILEEESNRVYPANRFSFAAETTSIQPGQQKIEARVKAEYTFY
jgi:uncharacterized protein YggE